MSLKFIAAIEAAKTGYPAVLAWAKHKLGLSQPEVEAKSKFTVGNITDFSDGASALEAVIVRLENKLGEEFGLCARHILNPGQWIPKIKDGKVEMDGDKPVLVFSPNPDFILSGAVQKEFHRKEIMGFLDGKAAADYCKANGIAISERAPTAAKVAANEDEA